MIFFVNIILIKAFTILLSFNGVCGVLTDMEFNAAISCLSNIEEKISVVSKQGKDTVLAHLKKCFLLEIDLNLPDPTNYNAIDLFLSSAFSFQKYAFYLELNTITDAILLPKMFCKILVQPKSIILDVNNDGQFIIPIPYNDRIAYRNIFGDYVVPEEEIVSPNIYENDEFNSDTNDENTIQLRKGCLYELEQKKLKNNMSRHELFRTIYRLTDNFNARRRKTSIGKYTRLMYSKINVKYGTEEPLPFCTSFFPIGKYTEFVRNNVQTSHDIGQSSGLH